MKNKFPYRWNLKDGYPAKAVDYHGSTVFSCFAGGGGSTMGYKLAGYNVLGCNEIDPKMNSIYNLNHNPKYSFLEAIQTFKKRKDFPKELYDLDILDGSPPCSSFSIVGKRSKYWGKKRKFAEGQVEQVLDRLFFDFIDLAEKLQPKLVIAENVPGILIGDAMSYKVNYVSDIYQAFNRAGYVCQHLKLDSSIMGVPQKRQRIFFIALRKDITKFNQRYNLIEDRPKITLRFNFNKINFGKIRSNKGTDNIRMKQVKLLAKYKISSDNKISDIWKRIFNKNHGFTHQIIKDNQVSPTIVSGNLHYRFFDNMVLSKNDLILIGTFPLDYIFNLKTISSINYIIGMSVPPVMMAQIANQIYKQWLKKLKK